jgi:hypothetical protein
MNLVANKSKKSFKQKKKQGSRSTFYPGGTLKLINGENTSGLLEDIEMINSNLQEEKEEDSESRRVTPI